LVLMRLAQFLALGFSALTFALAASDSPEEHKAEPEISVVAAFPESNPFGHVVNGEKNNLVLTVENRSDKNATLLTVHSAVYHPESGVLIKNLTTSTFGIVLPVGTKLNIPYAFYSEFKPGDLRLNVWLVHTVGESKYTVLAYDSIVTVVEPEASLLDFKLISTYLIVACMCGGLLYLAYLSFVPQSKKRKAALQNTVTPVSTATASGAGGYQEEWIPEHHLRKTKSTRKESGAASGASGDELSGGDASGTENKRRKGKGRK